MTSDAVNTSDDRAVAEVLDEVYAAWASGDADAFTAPYAGHATAVLPGSYLQSIRFPSADTAIVISKGGIIFAGQTGTAAETRSMETWVLSRQDGTWRIQAFHNRPEIVA